MKLIKDALLKYTKGLIKFDYYKYIKNRWHFKSVPLRNELSSEYSIGSSISSKNENFKTDDLAKFISADENIEKRNTITNEVYDLINKNRPCPENLNLTKLSELCLLDTKTQRIKYLKYLFKQEKLKERDRLLKEQKRKENTSKLKKDFHFGCDFSKYGLGSKTLLIRIRKQSFNKYYNRRLANAVLFGSKIVIDLDYDKYMIDKETRSCAAQLRHLMVANKNNNRPFDLYFCNANPNYRCVKHLKNDIPNLEDACNILCEGSYLDYFPNERLVYLSPHADETLKCFDPNAIYIIGGFVDLVKRNHISSEKAINEGIKSYSLPLDDHIRWKQGSKSLTIDQVFEIMLNLKNTGDWKKALKCIPTRKIQCIKAEEQELKEEELPRIQAVTTN